MKKLFALILAITMIASMSVTAFAENITGGSTEVSFDVGAVYTITIPTTVTLMKKDVGGVITYENDYTITAEEGVRLNKNASIEVTLASDFEMKTEQGATLSYTITQDNSQITAENNKIATFTTSTSKQESTIHISANDPKFAGEYKDTVTFTIEVVSTPSAPATISFSIDGTTYQAEEGMTWAQWADSSYNNDGKHFLSEDGWICHVDGGGLEVNADSVIPDGYKTNCQG